MNQENFQYDYFISYSSKDIEEVVKVSEIMNSMGLKVFISNDNLKRQIGSSFFEIIDNALRNSKNLLLFATINSLQSEWVKTEYETFFNEYYVLNKDSRKIVILKGNSYNSSILPSLLKRFQIANSLEEVLNSNFEHSISNKNTSNNIFVDSRDQQVYPIATLNDGRIWMVKNLNFDTGEGCNAYNNDSENRERYGLLYTWAASFKACPKGWHIPSEEEWKALTNAYGGYNNLFNNGEAAYHSLINGGGSGFSAELGGTFTIKYNFAFMNNYGDYWSSNEYKKHPFMLETEDVRVFQFHKDSKNISRSVSKKYNQLSVRCIMD